MQRFRGGLVFKAHRLCVSLNFRLESNKAEEEEGRVQQTFARYPLKPGGGGSLETIIGLGSGFGDSGFGLGCD